MAGNLYQLRARIPYPVGAQFLISGPHDAVGVVVKCEHKPDSGSYLRGGDYLVLVRGRGNGNL